MHEDFIARTETDEISLDRPNGRQYINWEPLAQRVLALDSPHKCIRIKRALKQDLREQFRQYIARRHNTRIAVRTRPGEAYIWKLGPL